MEIIISKLPESIILKLDKFLDYFFPLVYKYGNESEHFLKNLVNRLDSGELIANQIIGLIISSKGALGLLVILTVVFIILHRRNY